MRNFSIRACLIATCIWVGTASAVEPRINWYGTLQDGLDAAKRTNRPVLLIAGAPHCTGVPGTW